MRRKILALLLAAALALSLLAGCGGGKALSQVIVDLLGGLYSNVSVEADSDLTAALKQAAAEGGTEEEILSRMIEILNHKGGSITFTRLGSGQQGEHAVTLYFQPGTDPDAAARNALAQWAGTLGTLPDDGSYQGDVAMIETENGYYIALDVEVLKAGKPDKPDKDDDEPETQEPKDPYTKNADGNYTVNTENGLQTLFNDLGNDALSATITLTTDQIVTGAFGDYGERFMGTLQSAAGQKYTITLSSESGTRTQGLFYGVDGTVQNLNFELESPISPISGYYYVGAVAGTNYGNIQNCDVTISNDISGYYYVGAVAGWNDGGTISDCEVNLSGTITGNRTGGVASYNSDSGTIEGCLVEGGTIESKDSSDNFAGGVVGRNYGTVTACYSTSAVNGTNVDAGGVVGHNWSGGTVTACYHAVGEVSGFPAGGVVGTNAGTVNDCYWSGSPEKGIGSGNTGETIQVTADGDTDGDEKTVSWETALGVLNDPDINGTGYTFSGTMDAPSFE